MNYTITPELLSQYNHYLAKSGYSKATYQKYRGDLSQFCEYQKGKTIDEGLCETYRQYLLDHYTLRGACSKIVAVNTFLSLPAGISKWRRPVWTGAVLWMPERK